VERDTTFSFHYSASSKNLGNFVPILTSVVLLPTVLPSPNAHRGGKRTITTRQTDSTARLTKAAAMTEDTDDSYTVGGGEVNEKKRLNNPGGLFQTPKSPKTDSQKTNTRPSTYDPEHHRSHLLHAIEGLDRYPNYLSRWQEDDMDALETALEQRLEQVRAQKTKVVQQRKDIKDVLHQFLSEHPEWKDFVQAPKTWKEIQSTVLDPRAAKAIFRSNFFRQSNKDEDRVSVDDVLSGRSPVELDTAFLQEWMDEEMYDIYSFPLLSEEFCQKLHQFVSGMMEAMEGSSAIRGIHKDLDNMGMGWLNDLIFQLIVRPISSQLFKETELEGGDLDWRQGFVASYSASPTHSKPRERLVPHTDDAEVSIAL